MSAIEERLNALGITLPTPVAPIANYAPFIRTGNLLFISGQVSVDESGGIKGIVGDDVDEATGQLAAGLCGINLLAQMKAATGDLDRVIRVVKLGGFVQAGPDFFNIPQVINGCSDLMVEIFGDKGRHARAAVACPVLPMGAAVEVDAVVEFA